MSRQTLLRGKYSFPAPAQKGVLKCKFQTGPVPRPLFVNRRSLGVNFQSGPQRRVVSHGEEECGDRNAHRNQNADQAN